MTRFKKYYFRPLLNYKLLTPLFGSWLKFMVTKAARIRWTMSFYSGFDYFTVKTHLLTYFWHHLRDTLISLLKIVTKGIFYYWMIIWAFTVLVHQFILYKFQIITVIYLYFWKFWLLFNQCLIDIFRFRTRR